MIASVDSQELIDIVFRAALCEHSALGIWAQNLPTFRKMLGEEDYVRVISCIRGIFLQGIDWV
jgi:hypothetical protein